jgi:microcompartment protein CcmL/EutN
VLELASIAVGIEAGDAMVKRAPVDVVRAGTIHPGRYIVLVAGSVADVEEAYAAGIAVGAACLVDAVLLPDAHPAVIDGLRGARRAGSGEALGVVETASVAAIVDAADAGLKGARVDLLELRLGDGIGGKGYLLFDGDVADVEAAVELALARVDDGSGAAGGGAVPGGRQPVGRVIAQLHREMRTELQTAPRFGERIGRGAAGGEA